MTMAAIGTRGKMLSPTNRWPSIRLTPGRCSKPFGQEDHSRCDFNYRYNPAVQQARVMIRRGELGNTHFIHGAYLQDWLLTQVTTTGV